MNRWVTVALSGALAFGCTIINAPDDSLLKGDPEIPRAGSGPADSAPDADADTDAGTIDAGTDVLILLPPFDATPDGMDDGGSQDGGDASLPDAASDGQVDGQVEELLEDCLDDGNEDEDLNGLANCADFACAALERCCDQGTVDFDEEWGDQVGDSWTAIPTTGGLALPRISEGQVIEFGDDGAPRALMRTSCTPLALGVKIEARLQTASQGGALCEGETEVDCFAGIVLTAALDALPGRQLTDDLAVHLNQEGCLTVTSAGAVLQETDPFGAGHTLLVVIDITPTADASRSLIANISVEDLTALDSATPIIQDYTFVSQSDLITDVAGCSQIPGLMLAVQGIGDRVAVGRVTATTKRCINPSLFHPVISSDELSTMTVTRLGLGPWANGHIGAPALFHSPAPTGERWDLMAEATNAACELETWTHVGFALAHAYTSHWDADPWSGTSGSALGSDPPSCIGQDPSCQQGTSLREPTFWGLIGDDQLLEIRFAYARQQGTIQSGTPVRYAIYGGSSVPSEPMQERRNPILTPDDLAAFDFECDSLRDPNLVARGPDPVNDGFWLFFTCERDGQAKRILAARMYYSLSLHDEVHPVMSPDQLGDYGAGGVWGPEVVLSRNPETDSALFRLWFMARSGQGSKTVVAMVQGQATGKDFPERFVPYEANPVLTEEAQVLGPCQGICTLKGLAVAARHDDPSRLRLLLARRLLGQDMSTSELIPLDQFWKSP